MYFKITAEIAVKKSVNFMVKHGWLHWFWRLVVIHRINWPIRLNSNSLIRNEELATPLIWQDRDFDRPKYAFCIWSSCSFTTSKATFVVDQRTRLLIINFGKRIDLLCYYNIFVEYFLKMCLKRLTTLSVTKCNADNSRNLHPNFVVNI